MASISLTNKLEERPSSCRQVLQRPVSLTDDLHVLTINTQPRAAVFSFVVWKSHCIFLDGVESCLAKFLCVLGGLPLRRLLVEREERSQVVIV
jgi:hypothetical protein